MVPYSDDFFKLGKHLGLSIDIGPALMERSSKRMVRSFIVSHTEI